MWNGTSTRARPPRLADGVGRRPPVGRRVHAAVLGDGPQSVDDPPDGEERQRPRTPGRPTRPRPRSRRRAGRPAPRRIFHSVRRTRGVGRAEAGELLAEQPEARAPGGVAHQLAPEARAADRVARVERDVGLVGAELLAVVRHVDAPVGVGRRERRVAEEPPADEVVGAAVGEQQPVRGLVHQRRELRLRAPHEQEGEHVADRVAPPHREADDDDRLHPHRHHRPARCATTGSRAAGHGTRAADVRRRARDRWRGPA